MNNKTVIALSFIAGAVFSQVAPPIVEGVINYKSPETRQAEAQAAVKRDLQAKENEVYRVEAQAQLSFLQDQMVAFTDGVEQGMPPRNANLDALNWHNEFAETCEHASPLYMSNDFNYVSGTDSWSACLAFAEESAVKNGVAYNAGAVASYIQTLKDYKRNLGFRQHDIPAYK